MTLTTVTRSSERATPTEPSPLAGRSLRPPWTARRIALWIVGAAFAIVAVWAFVDIGVNPLTLWFERDDVGNLLRRMWPPRITNFGPLWKSIQETFSMAFLGTALAVVLAVPVGFMAARNIMPFRPVRAVARALIVGARAVPDLVLAIIFLRVWSIGPLAGVVALGVHSVGMLGKLFADSIEQIDRRPRDGVAATGAGRFQELFSGVLPQVVPAFIAATLYRLDINFRSATVLGIVGAGGIGFFIQSYKGTLRYPELLGLTILVVILIIAMEAASAHLRAAILGHQRSRPSLRQRLRGGPRADDFRQQTPSTAAVAGGERRLTPPWTTERTTVYGFAAAGIVLTVLAFVLTDLSLRRSVAGLRQLPGTVWQFVPKNFDWWLPRFWNDFRETIQMGFAATLLALIFAVPTGFLAARNVAPARWVYAGSRLFVLLLRALPDLVIAVIFVAALGLGPKPGVLALSIGLYAFASKLFADAIEEVTEGPRDGVRATGAGGVQESVSSVLSQAMPSIVGNSLYLLDVSIRSSVVLGIVGAGGIGFPLIQARNNLRFEQVGGIVAVTFVIVYAIELIAGWVRKRII